MKFTSLVARAFRGLKTARVRTLLTAMAIAVGGFVLTLTLAASNGTRQYADSIIGDAIADNALIISKTNFNSAEEFTKPQKYDGEVSIDGSSIKYLDAADIEKIKGYDFIESADESYQITAQYLEFQKDGKPQQYRGTLYGDAPSQRSGELAAGDASELKSGEMIISDAFRAALGYEQANDLVGTAVKVMIPSPMSLVDEDAPARAETFTIAGVAKASGLSGNPLGIYINRADAKELSEYTTKGTPAYQKYLMIDATVKDGENQEVMQRAQQRLKDDGFESQSAKDAQALAGQIISVLQGIVFGFGAITLIASVFGVVNTMYISVLERTREIGLMKALGMSNRGLKWLFRIEAAWIGLLGGVIGSLLGWGVGSLLNPWITKQLDMDGSLLVFPVGQIAIMIFALMIVAMLAGILPARKAAKLDPVEALRTE